MKHFPKTNNPNGFARTFGKRFRKKSKRKGGRKNHKNARPKKYIQTAGVRLIHYLVRSDRVFPRRLRFKNRTTLDTHAIRTYGGVYAHKVDARTIIDWTVCVTVAGAGATARLPYVDFCTFVGRTKLRITSGNASGCVRPFAFRRFEVCDVKATINDTVSHGCSKTKTVGPKYQSF